MKRVLMAMSLAAVIGFAGTSWAQPGPGGKGPGGFGGKKGSDSFEGKGGKGGDASEVQQLKAEIERLKAHLKTVEARLEKSGDNRPSSRGGFGPPWGRGPANFTPPQARSERFQGGPSHWDGMRGGASHRDGMHGGPAASWSHSLGSIERKLDGIQKELDLLRREIRGNRR